MERDHSRETQDERKKKPQAEIERQNFFWTKNPKGGFKKLYRWELVFPGENRLSWLEKVRKACRLRSMMDSLLRYNYYIQNMPTQDIDNLQTHIQTEIIERVSCKFDKGQLDALFDEVNSDFIRLQNTMLFQQFLRSNDSAKLFSKPLDLEPAPARVVPEFGRLELESKKGTKEVVVLNLGHIVKSDAKSFDQMFKEFGLASLYSSS